MQHLSSWRGMKAFKLIMIKSSGHSPSCLLGLEVLVQDPHKVKETLAKS